MTTFWLSTHLEYACRHSGACCTAGWPIPIERERAAAVSASIAARQVEAPEDWCRPDPEAPAEVAGVLARRSDGACVFYRSRPPGLAPIGGCAIHAVRPVSCRHFPYVCVTDPRGVHVTLSHYCPTAAALLFDAEGEVAVVEGPAVPIDRAEIEGLDARESLPPIDPQNTVQPLHPAPLHPAPLHPAPLHPARVHPAPLHPAPLHPARVHPARVHPAPAFRARLLSWDAVTQWERALVDRLAGDTSLPDPPSEALFDQVREATAPGWSWPEAPADLEPVWAARVAPEWRRWSRVVGRYLAAKAHASWAMHLGDGPTAVERVVTLARTVLQVEASRACLERAAALDRSTLTRAIRQSDLLLVHYADPYRLYN